MKTKNQPFRGREFLVQWEGVDPETDKQWDPTWEPADEIEKPDNKDILEEFWSTQKKPKKKVTKPTRKAPTRRKEPPKYKRDSEDENVPKANVKSEESSDEYSPGLRIF